MEMTTYRGPAYDTDPQLADALAHRSFPADVKAAYEPNGGIIVSLTDDTGRNIAQQDQAARLTTGEYL